MLSTVCGPSAFVEITVPVRAISWIMLSPGLKSQLFILFDIFALTMKIHPIKTNTTSTTQIALPTARFVVVFILKNRRIKG